MKLKVRERLSSSSLLVKHFFPHIRYFTLLTKIKTWKHFQFYCLCPTVFFLCKRLRAELGLNSSVCTHIWPIKLIHTFCLVFHLTVLFLPPHVLMAHNKLQKSCPALFSSSTISSYLVQSLSQLTSGRQFIAELTVASYTSAKSPIIQNKPGTHTHMENMSTEKGPDPKQTQNLPAVCHWLGAGAVLFFPQTRFSDFPPDRQQYFWWKHKLGPERPLVSHCYSWVNQLTAAIWSIKCNSLVKPGPQSTFSKVGWEQCSFYNNMCLIFITLWVGIMIVGTWIKCSRRTIQNLLYPRSKLGMCWSKSYYSVSVTLWDHLTTAAFVKEICGFPFICSKHNFVWNVGWLSDFSSSRATIESKCPLDIYQYASNRLYCFSPKITETTGAQPLETRFIHCAPHKVCTPHAYWLRPCVTQVPGSEISYSVILLKIVHENLHSF